MQPVRKREKRNKAFLIIPLIVILVCGAALYWQHMRISAPLPSPSGNINPPEQVKLVNKLPQDLSAFEVFPQGHESYRLVRGENGFMVEGNPAFTLNEQMITTMTEDLTTINADKAGDINEVPGGVEALGIDGKHFHVTAEYADGSKLSFYFGDSAYTDIPSDYLMLSDDSTVYTISPQIRSNLDHHLGALHPIPRIDFNSDLMSSLEIIISKDDAFSLTQQGALWQVSSPFIYPASPSAVAAIKKNISDMRLAVYIGEADALDLQAYGLIQPRRTVRFNLAESVIITPAQDDIPGSSRQVPAQSLSFAVGNDIDRIGFYCLYEGAVYQASYASMGFLTTLSLDGLFANNPVTIPINQLHSLEVMKSGERRQYQVELIERIEKNNALAYDATGQQIFDPVITLDGEELNSDEFIQEYLKLMDITSSGKLPQGFKPEGTPIAIYVLKTEQSSLELAFYPFDALHLAMVVNGQTLYYTTKESVEGLKL